MKRKILYVFLAGLIALISSCALFMYTALRPLYFPAALPGYTPTLVDSGSGSGGSWGHYAYLANVSLADAERYYLRELEPICVAAPAPHEIIRSDADHILYLVKAADIQACIAFGCDLDESFRETRGDFRVEICSLVSGQTHVYYVNHSED